VNTPEQPQSSHQDIIQLQDLHQISQELWDNPIYGDVAQRWIDYTDRAMAHGTVYANEQGFLVRLNVGSHQVAKREEIGPIVRKILPHCPYALLLAPSSPADRQSHEDMGHKSPDYRIYPDELRASRLAEYMHARKLNEHAFHGSLGKALDVMGVACELIKPKVVGAAHVDEPFIDNPELRRVLAGAPANISQKRDTFIKVRDHARRQIMRGRVGEIGEVILEGPVAIGASGNFTWSSVACSSLANAIAATCRPGNTMADFLRQQFGTPGN
jgi:hypothetical protein